mmetsp:Transcript_625/g.984  ORF Transcript_625/g.984 Transcript_625/m.984 type:complete len:381 (-) Transcript_625:1366-2508(-)|eukprot:CAMPEP_0194217774 /NCGR_PEP_ID=MMETSP0156-20130528/22245_1 /TAXON_ID=33649 /ORGANISM="Thalassionema nitzschioides, Strain L26-B" /LENGTH=380 /DNA_ID=CAMNT_0038946907 /DNA_START=53 /DNA_END=1195 /DNA_ORIENTATION=-
MTKEEWEIRATEYKSEADAAFRRGDFEVAIANYSNALELDPQNHVLLSNRSAANLKASNKSKALADAKACIAENPSFVKGYSRLGAAQQSLGRWKDAKESYQQVLDNLDPENAVAKKGIENCVFKIKEDDELREKEQKMQEEKSSTGDDLLDDFFSEVETAVTKKKEESKEEEKAPTMISDQKKGLGTAQEQIERLLAPNYKWKNLNPFYVMDMTHMSDEDEIGRRYKALSLLLHPDKCRNNKSIDESRAKLAYDEVQRAKKQVDDEDKVRHVRGLIEQGMKVGRQLWQKKKKEGVDNESLEDIQEKEVQRIFAQIELKRREVEQRERKYEQRERKQEEDELEKERQERRFNKNWREETRVDKRIGNWRDFQKKGKKRKV